MPQFVIEREIPGAGSLSEAQIREISLHSLQTLKQMGPQIQWLNSYVTEDKVYCVYLAPDEETIREHARKSGIPKLHHDAWLRLRKSPSTTAAIPCGPPSEATRSPLEVTSPPTHTEWSANSR
jgi:hypothetical protein